MPSKVPMAWYGNYALHHGVITRQKAERMFDNEVERILAEPEHDYPDYPTDLDPCPLWPPRVTEVVRDAPLAAALDPRMVPDPQAFAKLVRQLELDDYESEVNRRKRQYQERKAEKAQYEVADLHRLEGILDQIEGVNHADA